MVKKKPTNDRFAQLIHDEFGEDVVGPGVAERRRRPSRSGRQADDASPDWFSLDRALTEAEPDYLEADRFVPPPAPPLNWPRHPLTIIGLVCLMPVLAMIIAWFFGVNPPGWWRMGSAIALGVSLGCFLLRIPRRRHRNDDPDDEGIRL